MELDISVCQKVNFPCVRPVIPLTTDHRVSVVGDRAQFKQCLVELGQSGQVVSANVHVMKLELHRSLFRLSSKSRTAVAAWVRGLLTLGSQALSERYFNLLAIKSIRI